MNNSSSATHQAPVPPPPVADSADREKQQPVGTVDDDCHGDFGEGGDGESVYEELSG